ncbi:hypothetical protein ACS0TY_018308 [Phlomoides rotata]
MFYNLFPTCLLLHFIICFPLAFAFDHANIMSTTSYVEEPVSMILIMLVTPIQCNR